jgi:hypothetical protein
LYKYNQLQSIKGKIMAIGTGDGKFWNDAGDDTPSGNDIRIGYITDGVLSFSPGGQLVTKYFDSSSKVIYYKHGAASPFDLFDMSQTEGALQSGYSITRRLLTSYSGPLFRVKRSSDGTEQDISFDSEGLLDESALTTFVGAGDGHIVTWYNQKDSNADMTLDGGNPGNNLYVVEGGVVNTMNGFACGSCTNGTNLKILNTTHKCMVAVMSTTDTQGILGNYGTDANLTSYSVSWQNGNSSTTLAALGGVSTGVVSVDGVSKTTRDQINDALADGNNRVLTIQFGETTYPINIDFNLFWYNFAGAPATAKISELVAFDENRDTDIDDIIDSLVADY